jgi:hypothetical protein
LTAALETGEGPIELATSVELFTDDEAASAFIEDQLGDYERFAGRDVEGFTLVDVTNFDVEEVGDEANGFVAEASLAEIRLFGTVVVFRLGRLVGAVVISRLDDRDVRAEAERLARELESRIEGVIAGDVTGAPVPLPEDEEESAPTSEPPAGAPDISGLALQLEDVPGGYSVASEGYVADTNTRATFEREFNTAGGTVGGTRLVGLTSGVDLFDDESAAALSLRLIARAYTSPAGRREFARNFAAGAGFEADEIDVRELQVGRDTEAIHALIKTPAGTFETVFLYTRVGPAVGSLIAVGAAAEFQAGDVLGLLDPMRRRLGSEPG